MREQVRQYRRLFLVGLLLLAMLLLYSANLRRQGTTTMFERGVLAVSTPLLQGIDAVADAIGQLWYDYVWLVRVKKENDQLRENIRQLRVRLQIHREYGLENERLKALLAFSQTQERPALPAQVVGEDMSQWARTILLDKGTRDGLKEGLPVVVSEGVVGQTIKCGPYQSRVLLVTDASAAMGSIIQRTRTRGVARGRGEILLLDFALRQEDLVVGDTVLTSGMGGVYPKGLVIGTISQVQRAEYGLFQQVEVEPAVDFSRLEEVLVLLEPLE